MVKKEPRKKKIYFFMILFGALISLFGISTAGLFSTIADTGNPIIYIYDEDKTIITHSFAQKCVGGSWSECPTTETTKNEETPYNVKHIIKGATIFSDGGYSYRYGPWNKGNQDKTYDVLHADTGVTIGTLHMKLERSSNAGQLWVTFIDIDGNIYDSHIKKVLGENAKVADTVYDGDLTNLPINWGGWARNYLPFSGWTCCGRGGFDARSTTFTVDIGVKSLPDKDGDGFHIGLDRNDNDKYVTTIDDAEKKIRLYFISKELIEQLQAEAEVLQGQIDNLKSERDDLLDDIVILNEEISGLNLQIADIIQKLLDFSSILSEQIGGIDISINQIKETHDRILKISNESLEITETTIPKVDLLIVSRKDDITSLNLGIEASENIINKLQTTIFTGEAEEMRIITLDYAKQINLTFSKQLQKAELELGILIEVKTALEKKKELEQELMVENIKLSNQIIELQSKVQELNLTVAEMTSELDDLKTINERQAKLIGQQLDELEMLKIKNAELDGKLKELEDNRNAIIAEYEKLVKILEGYDAFKNKFGNMITPVGLVFMLTGIIGLGKSSWKKGK